MNIIFVDWDNLTREQYKILLTENISMRQYKEDALYFETSEAVSYHEKIAIQRVKIYIYSGFLQIV